MFHTAMILVALSATAFAGSSEPSTPTVAADDTVTTDVVVSASPAQVRSALSDPRAAATLSDGVTSVSVLGKDGPCDLVEVTCKGVTSPLVYVARRCPTADGFTETLVRSDDFDAHSAQWHLEPVAGGGTRITFELRTEPDLPLPRRIIQAAVQSSAVETVRNLVRRVTGR